MSQEVVYRAYYNNSVDGLGHEAKVYAAGFFLTEDEAWNWLDKNYNAYNRRPINGWKSDSQYMCGVESLFYHYGETHKRIAELKAAREKINEELRSLS